MDKDILKNVKNDRFAQLLGIEIVEASPGYALVEMKIEDKHKNGIILSRVAQYLRWPIMPLL